MQDKVVKKLDIGIKNTIIKNVKAMIAHKIGGMAVFSTSNLILSKFVGLTAVGLYSNYYLVINAINSFASQFFASVTASIRVTCLRWKAQTRKIKFFRLQNLLLPGRP